MQRYEVRTPSELVRRGAKDVERGLHDTECRGAVKPQNCPAGRRPRKAAS